jgi:predicted negative regulator of RcsB-dependent stress response
MDPQEAGAQQAIDEGNALLEQADIEGARSAYAKSVSIKETATGM